MKRPAWIILVSVLAMIVGFWGMVGNLFSIISYVYVETGSEVHVMDGIHNDQIPQDESVPNRTGQTQIDEHAQNEDTAHREETLKEPSQWLFESQSWAVTRGALSLLVSGAYVLAGVFLITKSFGTKFFYSVMFA